MVVVGWVNSSSLLKTQTPPLKILNHRTKHPPTPTPPIFISTNPSHINPNTLQTLFTSCNHSCHRFPNTTPDGHVEPVDVTKLKKAVLHSSVVVSVFAKGEGEWYDRMVPLNALSGEMVGFGRAVCDGALTASIYDVMVIPSLQGRGIGRMILQRIIRLLTNKGIYDIAALCSDQEMDFFKACGFGDDMLGSTTMMYTRSGNDMVISADKGDFQTPVLIEVKLKVAEMLAYVYADTLLQWFAVGWIDPNNKYCTNVDASGNANPKWKTKFSALVDNSDSKFDDLALNVEVYSRDPIFLKERLQGTAIVGLKEFLDKHKNNSEESSHVEEVGSFQLRKKNSNKPQGFIDVSVKISQETDEGNSYEGDEVGIKLKIRDHGVNLPSQVGHSENHLQTNYPTMLPPGPSYHQPRAPVPLNYPLAGGPYNHQPSHTPSIGPNNHRLQTQPPPPQYNVGYMPPSSMGNLPTSYINLPSSAGARPGPGFAMGLGAGALAAGAAIFGEDFVSGFDLPSSFTISTDPPF